MVKGSANSVDPDETAHDEQSDQIHSASQWNNIFLQ